MAGQGKFFIYTIDKLHVKYLISIQTYTRFVFSENTEWHFSTTDTSGNNKMECPEMKLVRTSSKFKFKIQILKPDDSGSYFEFGEFIINPESDFTEDEKAYFHEKIDDSGTCFINLNNRTFYDPLITTHIPTRFYKKKKRKPKVNLDLKNISNLLVSANTSKVKAWQKSTYNGVFLINQVVEFLGLIFMSISNFEIALDSNVNFGSKIWQAIKDPNLVPYINGKSYEEIESDKRIKGFSLHHSVTRRKMVDMTVYISQSEKNLRLKSYNKSREVENNSFKKQYILDKAGKSCDLFRLEITVKNSWIIPMITKLYGKDRTDDFFMGLSNETELEQMFRFWIDKLIYFKQSGTSKRINLFDVI